VILVEGCEGRLKEKNEEKDPDEKKDLGDSIRGF
jgi:hypothetical protein